MAGLLRRQYYWRGRGWRIWNEKKTVKTPSQMVSLENEAQLKVAPNAAALHLPARCFLDFSHSWWRTNRRVNKLASNRKCIMLKLIKPIKTDTRINMNLTVRSIYSREVNWLHLSIFGHLSCRVAELNIQTNILGVLNKNDCYDISCIKIQDMRAEIVWEKHKGV